MKQQSKDIGRKWNRVPINVTVDYGVGADFIIAPEIVLYRVLLSYYSRDSQ